MKVYIFTDMEGISGISGSDFVLTDGRCYAQGCRYMTWDINACARGCFNGGATAVVARDGHGGGNNVIWSEVDPRVELVQGAGGPRRFPGFEDADAVILLGYHAMAGVRGAVLEHTYSSKHVQNLWLNGKLVGELGVDAAVAGELGKPVIMASGDDALCAEARAWIPQALTCQVKTSFATQGSCLLPKDAAHRLIEETAAAAVRRAASIEPLRVTKPVTMRLEVIERGGIPGGPGRPDLKVLDGRTVETTADSVEAALRRLW